MTRDERRRVMAQKAQQVDNEELLTEFGQQCMKGNLFEQEDVELASDTRQVLYNEIIRRMAR